MISEDWLLLGAGLGVLLLIVLVAVWIWLRRRRRPLVQALNGIAIHKLQNVLLPDGMGGQIQFEYLLLTAKGLVVIDVKQFEGAVFASDRMEEWTVIGQQGRFTFPNPLGTLYDRIAALRQLVRDVPVTGHVLFSQRADFSKGRPKDVVLPHELSELYSKPERAEVEKLRQAFGPHWDLLKQATEPVKDGAGIRLD